MSTTTTSKAAAKRENRAKAIDQLREIFPERSLITTMVTHVSSSGMARDIVVLAPSAIVYPVAGATTASMPASVEDVSWLVARALDWPLTSRRGGNGVRVRGCGMDMAFHTIYSLANVLYGNGYALTTRTL